MRNISIVFILGSFLITIPSCWNSQSFDEDEDGGADSDADGDTDGDTDSDADSDADGDSDGDADSDADGDADSDADADTDTATAPFCDNVLDGFCSDLHGECAYCPDDMIPHFNSGGCTYGTWCCHENLYTVTNECMEQGGVCVPWDSSGADDAEERPGAPPADSDYISNCPTGWEPVYTACNYDGETCCMPGPWCEAPATNCDEVGGVCTGTRWEMCPPGTEPYDDPFGEPELGCGMMGDGYCCVKAPPSSCSEQEGVMCLSGDTCEGCFSEPFDNSLTCQPGRVCCQYICN